MSKSYYPQDKNLWLVRYPILPALLIAPISFWGMCGRLSRHGRSLTTADYCISALVTVGVSFVTFSYAKNKLSSFVVIDDEQRMLTTELNPSAPMRIDTIKYVVLHKGPKGFPLYSVTFHGAGDSVSTTKRLNSDQARAVTDHLKRLNRNIEVRDEFGAQE